MTHATVIDHCEKSSEKSMPFKDEPPTEVGCPIPANTPHAVSVTLPSWAANIAYEEGEAWVADKMTSGYPRFFIHHKIKELCKRVEDTYGRENEQCMIFPTYNVAKRCRDFMLNQSSPSNTIRILQLSTPPKSAKDDDKSYVQCHIAVVFFAKPLFPFAKAYWQHTGEGISSRMGQYVLEHMAAPTKPSLHSSSPPPRNIHAHSPSPPPSASVTSKADPRQAEEKEQFVFMEERFGRNLDLNFAPAAKQALRKRIASIVKENVSPDDVFLYPTGMTTIFSAHRLLLDVIPEGHYHRSVCFGFPYTDTIKILTKWGAGVHFYGNGESSDLDELEKTLIAGHKILALFCEFPSNPLLKSPDLQRISEMAKKYNFAVVVDETVGNFVNVRVLPYADMVVSSLTKVFSGDCNVMGGSLVLNPQSRYYEQLKATLKRPEQFEDLLWAEDAIYLERNSRDFAQRNVRINENAQAVTRLLAHSPLLKQLYYPEVLPTKKFYDHCKLPEGGYGGLFSIVFKDPNHARQFFDNINIAKGPSLGTNFTLTCPYTLIAHYTELDEVEKFGVDRNLVRISVGLEDTTDLLDRFKRGLDSLS